MIVTPSCHRSGRSRATNVLHTMNVLLAMNVLFALSLLASFGGSAAHAQTDAAQTAGANEAASTPQSTSDAEDDGRYDATWTALRRHTTPRWLVDAKFGIYTHWGLSTVRYQEEHHGKTLEEAIELFNPVKFQPKEWAQLFKDAGAKFAGPVAWHGSDYLHWDSQHSQYNSAKLNPHIDIVAELEKAYRAAGLKFMISYHYGSGERWLKLAKEGVDLFSPDLFWVDANFGGTKGGHHSKLLKNSKYIGQTDKFPIALEERYQLQFISHYFNHGMEANKEVEFIYKSFDIPPGVAMRDLENGMLNEIAYDTWMTDIDMSVPPDWKTHGWFYNDAVPLRSADDIVDILVDVVSKNGILLLNVPPKADGDFSDTVKQTLRDVGKWLEINGEAIYGASPWFIYGEGPASIPEGNWNMHHNNHFGEVKFSGADIRFTVNGEYLYAICLGWPGEELLIKALNTGYRLSAGSIEEISLLGYEQPITWQHDAAGVKIEMPAKEVAGNSAFVFKIKRKNN